MELYTKEAGGHEAVLFCFILVYMVVFVVQIAVSLGAMFG